MIDLFLARDIKKESFDNRHKVWYQKILTPEVFSKSAAKIL